MAFGWLAKEVKSSYIARPAEAANQLVHLHPDKSIPRGAKLTVRSDECALFFREGRYIGRIDAGTVLLDTANIPFLGHLLIDNLTDGNHFICEVFFVLLTEVVFHVPPTPLGQYKDKNSANVVAITGAMSYTVKVSDPARLILEVGGQNRDSGFKVEFIFNGRMLNLVRRAVAVQSQQVPVLEIVSNVTAEAIAQEVRQSGHAEFTSIGIGVGRVFELNLQLDEESLKILRDFGQQESELALQAKGMKLAASEGFAEYNLIQGQRAALEGLGKGLGTGNSAMVMSGFNIGGNLTGGGARPASRPAPARSGTIISTSAMFILKDAKGASTGPYSPRQIALMAISRGQRLSDLQIRGTEDPEDAAFSADLEPQIAAEYKRRLPAQPPGQPATPAPSTATTTAGAPNPNAQAFGLAFSAATREGQISLQDIDLLTNLAVTLGLDADAAAAKARVSALIQANNIRITV